MDILVAPEVEDAPELTPSYSYDDDGYLVGDGLPMAEHDTHRGVMNYLIEALDARYADRTDVYVAGNNFVHYREGDRNRYVAPDAYVVFGVGKGSRLNFKTWEEGASPGVVFEITSRSTRREDEEKKYPLYERVMRVPEYFRFDPTGDYLKPRLQGSRLAGGVYAPVAPDEDGRVWSESLGLYLVAHGEYLRLLDPDTGEFLRTYKEAERRGDEATRQVAEATHLVAEAMQIASEQKRRADAAEAEIASLRAELERLRSDAGRGAGGAGQRGPLPDL